MRKILKRSRELYRQNGLTAVYSGIIRTIKSKYRFSYRKVQNYYWDIIKKPQKLHIGQTFCLFGATTAQGGPYNRKRFSGNVSVLRDLRCELKPDDVFVDVGANTGIYTCFAAKWCSRIIAIEPYFPNVEQLENNLMYNNIDNVYIYNVALWNSNEMIELERPNVSDIGYGGVQLNLNDSVGKTFIQALSGDDFFNKHNLTLPTVIKLDAEGAEYQILEGFRKCINNDHFRILYCDIHIPESGGNSIKDFGKTRAELLEMLTNHGFKITFLKKNLIKAKKQ